MICFVRPDRFAIAREGFSGSDGEVHFNDEGVAGWGGSVAGARRFFVKVYNDGGKFGGIKNSSRSSLLKRSALPSGLSSGRISQSDSEVTGLGILAPRN